MKKGYAWLYLFAAALALLAVIVRLYGWLVAGKAEGAWEMAVPAIFFVVLLVMWRGAHVRERRRGDDS
ncbi:MAG: hypothetical protein ACM3YM_10705 [Sphingomonadales bacterium]